MEKLYFTRMNMLLPYFSITQFKNVIKLVHERAHKARVDVPTLKFTGTVKMHGTNSSVYSNLATQSFVTQSKSCVITPTSDNHGFAAYAGEYAAQFKHIFMQVTEQFPDKAQAFTCVIYGEWCGAEVQKTVALAQLPKMFVAFSIKLTPNTQSTKKNPQDEDYWLSRHEIEQVMKGSNLYNVYDFQTWEVDIDMRAPKAIQNKLIDVTNAVEQECPVAAHFGAKGLGEGVVWRCVSVHPEIKTDDLVFKVKGKEHSVTHVKTIAEVDTQVVSSVNQFVEQVVTPNRLMQGLDNLRERHLEMNIQNVGVFLKWVSDDCFKEESDLLGDLEKKDVSSAVMNKARRWYFEKVYESTNIVTHKIF